ncbi:oxygenase MpaB family protein [Rhodococcus sp. UNC363MFTsu5.1]|uniref:oxygenase MpaB family protein n=1 Tax=Rhodococcus sp. UNC363MFTsu5.1 TaxID=1449069 RepID=UPI0009DFA187|nr:oxygenase MpaB family protein [Rhodococcus sp. UNC363MFTsu5.1]
MPTPQSDRFAWRDRIALLDNNSDCREIVRILHHHEFPWDLIQAESLAQFRTFAVPSIGQLLYATGEYTERVQKRFDDTALILGTFIEHDFGSEIGRRAIRRLNNMHGAYDIANGDMLYTLTTLVVGPVRWISRYGWRDLTDHEITALTNHLRTVGHHMGIKEIPTTYADFVTFHDDYERTHFAYSAGGRAVADSTLDLMATFPPNDLIPPSMAKRIARALMDEPLANALGYRRPSAVERVLVSTVLKARGRLIRRTAPRTRPLPTSALPYIRSYPNGYNVEDLGTFPRGCPVPHSEPKSPDTRTGGERTV